jgi:hypothetical protein
MFKNEYLCRYNDFLSTTRSRLDVHMYVLSKDFISTQKTEMRKEINFAQLKYEKNILNSK